MQVEVRARQTQCGCSGRRRGTGVLAREVCALVATRSHKRPAMIGSRRRVARELGRRSERDRRHDRDDRARNEMHFVVQRILLHVGWNSF
jgi:hypothetical protein